ncbi:MAG: hypothetical protein DRQ64_08285 [Gammaproteobacteria bacterium]|nr:MAG: hypothetical protein DRQ64_08285 [Gammaproteobacteria bacterium]
MNNPKRHHFVPESYLSGFTESTTGMLNIYNKKTGLWLRQKPKKVMVRNKYYHQRWAPEGVDKNILEKLLGASIEPKGMESLRKLIKEPEVLDDEDSANILIYLQFQRLRVPRQADAAKVLAKNAITQELRKTSKGRDALKLGKVVIKDSFRFNFLQMAHGTLTSFFSRMVWQLIEAENGSSFITSDSPVSFHNVDIIPPAEPGPGLYGTRVFFPINKRYLLAMHHPEIESGEEESTAPLPKCIDIEDGLIEIRKDIVWDKKQVQWVNWFMFQQSQDLIVGESKEALETTIGRVI